VTDCSRPAIEPADCVCVGDTDPQWWLTPRALKAELIRRKHEPIAQIGEWRSKVVQGYYQYRPVPGKLTSRKSQHEPATHRVK